MYDIDVKIEKLLNELEASILTRDHLIFSFPFVKTVIFGLWKEDSWQILYIYQFRGYDSILEKDLFIMLQINCKTNITESCVSKQLTPFLSTKGNRICGELLQKMTLISKDVAPCDPNQIEGIEECNSATIVSALL